MSGPLSTEETIDRLARSISPAYAALRDFTVPQVRAAAASVIDLMVEEQLRVPDGFREACARAASLPPNEAIVMMQVWRDSLVEAQPDRKTVSFVLEHFPAWYERCPEQVREPWLAGVARLGQAMRGLGGEGMKTLMEAMACCDDHYSAHKLLETVAAYAPTTDEAVVAVTAMARAAARLGRLDLWLEIAQRFPPERMETSDEAEKALPALGEILDAAPDHPLPALRLMGALAGENDGTVLQGGRKLAVAAGSASDAGVFLDDARELIEALGIRALGAIVRRRPGHDLVESVLDLRAEFGAQAALRLLEKGSL